MLEEGEYGAYGDCWERREGDSGRASAFQVAETLPTCGSQPQSA